MPTKRQMREEIARLQRLVAEQAREIEKWEEAWSDEHDGPIQNPYQPGTREHAFAQSYIDGKDLAFRDAMSDKVPSLFPSQAKETAVP